MMKRTSGTEWSPLVSKSASGVKRLEQQAGARRATVGRQRAAQRASKAVPPVVINNTPYDLCTSQFKFFLLHDPV